jgi:hypothetical protein
MKRLLLLLLLALGALVLDSSGPRAIAATPSWQLAQPAPPPPPVGVSGVGRPLGLGRVGDIKFWGPNRGLLITGGNLPAIPPGLWAYDGTGWHVLSTVCGSGNGRIAWAGPDEFWTISDPAPNSQEAGQVAVTLCHFLNGAVVASYATPLGSADPYVTMTSAACNGPSDCWFGGIAVNPPLTGAFHLHWDGSALTDVLGPQDRQIESLAAFGGQFFESTFATNADQPVPPEARPVLLHRISEGALPSQEFVDDPFVPTTDPTGLSFLTLGTGGSELWAVGGDSSTAGARPPLAARFVNGSFQDLGIDPTSFTTSGSAYPDFLGVAPDPGAGDAWVTVGQQTSDFVPLPSAEVARIADNGTVLEVDQLPSTGSGQASHGSAAGPIACPAANDCWIVTKEGWLYHLTDGTVYPQDTDPNFAGLIDYRPPDAGTASSPPNSSPLDDSLANQPPTVEPTPPPAQTVTSPRPKKLVTHTRVKLRGTTLQLYFTLKVRARVSLAGVRGGRVVARARTRLLSPGRHMLALKLNVHDWPTKLKFAVTPITRKGVDARG